MVLKTLLIDNRRITGALFAALSAVGISAFPLYSAQLATPPEISQTVQYILDVVNTESGATRSSHAEDTSWAYSMTLASPCTFNLTEERQKVRLNTLAAQSPAVAVREIIHYSIPAADMEFGEFSTHHTLEPEGFMRVIIFTRRATIQRWYGNSSTPPQDAQAVFETSITFGKPDVDIFDIPAHLENALKHLTALCRCEKKGADTPQGSSPHLNKVSMSTQP
jgi:hypothetical protein